MSVVIPFARLRERARRREFARVVVAEAERRRREQAARPPRPLTLVPPRP